MWFSVTNAQPSSGGDGYGREVDLERGTVRDVRLAWAQVAGVEALEGGFPQVAVDPASGLAPRGGISVLVLDGTVTAAVLRSDLVMDVTELLFADRATFRPVSSDHPVERVTATDARLVALSGALGDQDAAEANAHDLALHDAIFAVSRDDELVAACGYEVWQDRLAHCSVFTHPGVRARGYGRAAASAAVAHALESGLVAQWRTRVPASRAIAVALGFRSLGAQLRFRADG